MEDCLSPGDDDDDLYSADRRSKGGKRRFSEEQIKSLETMFESQEKLEPRKKLQLARELGLQPRQVAIWFQNKRARWKSKQLERRYDALRADYDVLLSGFEVLKKEKHVLDKQVRKLAEMLDRRLGESSNGTESDKGEDNGMKDRDNEPDFVLRGEASYEEETKLSYACTKDETDLMSHWEEPASSSGYLGDSTEHLSCFDDGSCSPDKSDTTAPSQWWEFWPITD